MSLARPIHLSAKNFEEYVRRGDMCIFYFRLTLYLALSLFPCICAFVMKCGVCLCDQTSNERLDTQKSGKESIQCLSPYLGTNNLSCRTRASNKFLRLKYFCSLPSPTESHFLASEVNKTNGLFVFKLFCCKTNLASVL